MSWCCGYLILVFLGPSRRWTPRGVIVGSIWVVWGSSRRYSLRGIAKADQKKGREFTLGILYALWTHLARRQSPTSLVRGERPQAGPDRWWKCEDA
jgi:hypothetical protein